MPSPFIVSPEKRQTLSKLSALSLATLLPQGASATAIHALPRCALVIGNSAYPKAPLLNPGNDANAIAVELKRLGFSVDLQINASRESMENAMRSFSSTLAKQRGVGLFYYAGHGMQLDWHNFLVPVDARLDKAEDLPRQTIEIGQLLGSLGKAGNPMNIVVLDACRDNPFGAEHKSGKGLSQMDAPIGTLLAYATAPGNVASDGAGQNGLYTENLLKEMRAPEAKIEDVFKRVRLAVRRNSQGQQIPWESTSLEDDFYFIPPVEMRKKSQEELDRLFAQELAQWEAAKAAAEPAPLIAYLRNYPSGRFAELAQALLDRLLAQQGEKRVRISNSKKNPFTKGSAAAGQLHVGDRFGYRVIDLLTNVESKSYKLTLTAITDGEAIFNNGSTVTDLLGNMIKTAKGHRYGPSQFFAAEYSIGKKWSTRYAVRYADGREDHIERDFRITGKESVEVPAGTFDTFRVESTGWVMSLGQRLETTYWIAPGKLARFVAINEKVWNKSGRPIVTDRTELVSFTAGG